MAVSTLHDVAAAGVAGVAKGAFIRKPSVFRNCISATGDFPPESGRYILYVSYACPWASRCLAFRNAKGLEDVIGLAVVSPVWVRTRPDVDSHEGWAFDSTYPGATADPVFGARTVRDLYDAATEGLDTKTERYTVPILLDSKTRRIVNNESSEIIRFFNDQFNAFAKRPEVDLSPRAHLPAIDAMNDANYDTVNNGVYKCGFAQSQEAYDAAVGPLFQRLDELEELLGRQRYLIKGLGITESDIRLFVTIVRFDPVYVVHFKCSKKLIREYPNLTGWLRDVYQTASLEPSVNMRHIREHYFVSHKGINTFGIVPVMSPQGLDAPHGREALPL